MSLGSSPRELFQSGDLAAAIEAQSGVVRAHPTDVGARGFLVDLLCFQGNWERADRQLEALGTQDPRTAMGVALARQLVRAAQWRTQFFQEGRLPELLGTPSALLQRYLRASVLLREGDAAGAAGCLAEAEAERPRLRGTTGGRAFDDFRDLDDLCAGVLEVLTSTGKYYWIPLERVRTIEPHRAGSPRDLLWRRVSVVVADGPEGDVYLPALYAGSEEDGGALGVGGATDWRESAGGSVRGRGLRTFLVGDEARTLHELGPVAFEERS